MEVDAIVTDITRIVQDTTYDAPWIIGKLNEALTLVATICRIPSLQKTETVSVPAGAKSIPMPKSYLHDLYLVTTPTYPQGIVMAPNEKELTENSEDAQTGPAGMVALEGKILHIRPTLEAAEDLTLRFYMKPKELSAGDSFPDYIPEAIQKALFQNYPLQEAYLQIEDGIDGGMPNTQKYSGMTAAAITALVAFYPNAPKARPQVKRVVGWF